MESSSPLPTDVAAPETTSAAAPATISLAERLYPAPSAPYKATAPNADVQAVRDADPARKLYTDVSMLGPSNVRELALAIAPGADEAALTRHGTELASIAADLGLSSGDVSKLAGYARDYKKTPPTQEQREANHRKVSVELRAQYGKDIDRVMADARAVVKRDHRLEQLLEVSALGDHAEVIKLMVDAGRRARSRGQLR